MNVHELRLFVCLVILCGTGPSTATFIALHGLLAYLRRRGAGIQVERWREKDPL